MGHVGSTPLRFKQRCGGQSSPGLEEDLSEIRNWIIIFMYCIGETQGALESK